MESGQLTHLQLMRYSIQRGGTIKLEPSVQFTAQINPADVKHSHGLRYDDTKALGESANNPRYSAVEEERLAFSLVLDGTGVVPPAAGGQPSDVRTQIRQLNTVAYQYVILTGETPLVRLLWGTLIFFGRLDTIATTYTLFKPSGEPLRAKVDLSFRGAMSKKEAELVTSRQSEEAPTRIVVREGQTLSELCQQHYGEPFHTLEVARYNKLPNLLDLKPGTRLLMPPRK
ncbi:peptidoglycan-binding protein [Pseudorhodoferax sp. LjRoot39]|uniref:CIS tube protein n=1 Tax=Pseudorhodoferax sp. LjRoot39 TaxID=3342328 RepID=UPI003ECEA9F6